MREMMLDRVESRTRGLVRVCLRQQVRQGGPRPPIAQSLAHQGEARTFANEIANLAQKVRAAVLIERDMIHVGQAHAGLTQTIIDGLRGKTRPVLDATEALLLGRSEQLSVAQQRRCRIRVKSVEAENDQSLFSRCRTKS